MKILTLRMMITPVLLLTLSGGSNAGATPSSIDALAIQPVGFSIQFDFGHQKNTHDYRYRQHRRQPGYGHGYRRSVPHYDGHYERHDPFGWWNHGYKRKHHGNHNRKHRRHQYNRW